MPVTKTAKRALRSSAKKQSVNASLMRRLETAIRHARRDLTKEAVNSAISLADRAAKKKIIHQNKAARIKSQLSKLTPTKKSTPKKKSRPRKTK
ncbi:30S ribosomal protein S20 [Candidatus Woesebacteria bacterium]|nr:30S ribosomal protein S20 [Candidatus Woesebacteria bacterium]